VRETLIEREGPALAAKTTEEMAADQALRQRLGDDAERVLALLASADRAKFAAGPFEPEPERLAEWSHWVESFTGARTTITGR
jgi:hypothetical protein